MSWVNIQNFDDKGFPISKVGFFRGGKSEPISQRYILTLNGVNSYIQLPDVNLFFGDTVEFDFIAPTSATGEIRMMLSNTGSFATLVRLNADGSLVVQGGTATLDGSTNLSLSLDGLKHNIVYTSSVTQAFSLIGAQSNGSGGFLRFADFPIFNIKINDGSVYNYPIDDNSTTVIRNTGSGADATPINVTPSMWSLENA